MKHFLRNMSNCFLIQLRQPKRINSIDTSVEYQENVVRVMKMNGKVAVEYRSSVLVKDVLVNFNGIGLGISEGSSSSQILPPNYELRTGKVYYLLPHPESLIKTDNQLCGVVKQIKVIITKKQLQELLSRKCSIEDMISKVSKGLFHHDEDNTTRSWRPELETIPEGRE